MLFCQVNHYQSESNSFLTANHQHTAQPEYIINLGKINIFRVVVYAYSSPIAAPPPVPSAIHSLNPPSIPSACTGSDPPITAPSPMEIFPAAGQSLPTSDPPFTPFGKKFYCEYPGCRYGSNRKRDVNRHSESIHEGKKYRCPIPDCTKAYTRTHTPETLRENTFSQESLIHNFINCITVLFFAWYIYSTKALVKLFLFLL
jgi:hypothetical protein